MRITTCLLAFFWFASVAIAEDKATTREAARRTSDATIRAQHLLQAIDHLDAAGATAEADQARKRLAELAPMLLRRIAELEAARTALPDTADQPMRVKIRPVDMTDAGKQILIRTQVIEIDHIKLRELGIGLETVVKGYDAKRDKHRVSPLIALIDDDDELQKGLATLRKQKLLKILAEPTLVTTSGRGASFNVGGEFPVPTGGSLEYVKFGTNVNVVPQVRADGALRLGFRLRISERDETRTVKIKNFTIPGLRVREVDLDFLMKLNQTAVIGGSHQTRVFAEPAEKGKDRRQRVEEIETLVLVRAELPEAAIAVPKK